MKAICGRVLCLFLAFVVLMTSVTSVAKPAYAYTSSDAASDYSRGFWEEAGKSTAWTLIPVGACSLSVVTVPQIAPLICLEPAVELLGFLKGARVVGSTAAKLAQPAEQALERKLTEKAVSRGFSYAFSK